MLNIVRLGLFLCLYAATPLFADNSSSLILNSSNSSANSGSNTNKSLTIVSPEEFRANVQKRNIEILKQSASDYKNVEQALNPTFSSPSTSTVTPSVNLPTDNINTTPLPESPVETQPSEEEPSSSSFLQNNPNKAAPPNNQTGFNPYGTGN